jgi:hypothetical protein
MRPMNLPIHLLQQMSSTKKNSLFAGAHMKQRTWRCGFNVFALLALLVFSGCDKNETPPTSQKEKTAAKALPKSPFEEVTAQLDPGGDLYVYVGTEQWLQGISAKLAGWSQLLNGIPDLTDENRDNIRKAVTVVTNLVSNSGLEQVKALGLSSVPHGDGLHRSKGLLYCGKDNSSGFLWNLCGTAPHALTGLDLLPANTALAGFSDLDTSLVWSVLQKQVSQSGIPQVEELLKGLPEGFEKTTGLNWEKVLGSLGGEFGFAMTLDDSKTVSIPVSQDQRLEIPEPALMIVVRVKDDTVFNRIDEALKQSGQHVFSTDKAKLKMRTLPVPLPLPIQLGLTVAQSEGYLFIATTDLIVQQALAVRAGEKPGLKSTEEFQRLAKDVPQQGNHFTCVSQRLGQTMSRLQRQALAMTAAKGNPQQEWLRSLLSDQQPVFSYSVGAHLPEGWLMVANGNQGTGKFVLTAAVIPAAAVAAVAIPAIVKARQAASGNSAK